jgi:hypothetical protein
LKSTPLPKFQTLGQQLGTLMSRPQNPWAVRGKPFLAYLWENGLTL